MNNKTLASVVGEWLNRERRSTANLITALCELDARKLYLEAGYSSCFSYCTRFLRMGEGEAYRRIRVARMAGRFDGVLAALALGKVHLSALVELAPEMTDSNRLALLDLAEGKTKREVQALLADRRPKPDAPPLIRALPLEQIPESQLTPTSKGVSAKPQQRRSKPPVYHPEPLGQRRYKMQFTADQETEGLYRRAKALLSHAMPSASMAEVFNAALGALCDKLEKRRHGATSQPRRTTRVVTHKRTIAAAVKRQVSERDGRQCTFAATSGRRCEETHFLEYDHIKPLALGGPSTVENLRLFCRAHNQGRYRRAGQQGQEGQRDWGLGCR